MIVNHTEVMEANTSLPIFEVILKKLLIGLVFYKLHGDDMNFLERFPN